jgi:hypothetical protein
MLGAAGALKCGTGVALALKEPKPLLGRAPDVVFALEDGAALAGAFGTSPRAFGVLVALIASIAPGMLWIGALVIDGSAFVLLACGCAWPGIIAAALSRSVSLMTAALIGASSTARMERGSAL